MARAPSPLDPDVPLVILGIYQGYTEQAADYRRMPSSLDNIYEH
jgi:hypothetical protein